MMFYNSLSYNFVTFSRFAPRDARQCVSWRLGAFAPLREIGFRSNPSLKIII